jgi:uncharacterized spore protein YtfJ
MNLQELFRSLVAQAGVKTVYGDPVSTEGKTVIPVARIRCGFGGGSGKKAAEQEGGGGGGGFVAKPVGFIEISAQGTQFVPISAPREFALAVGLGVCLGFLLGKLIHSKE